MKEKKNTTRYVVQAAIIAAVYAALTVLFAPISYSYMQVRISEALTVLPALTPAAVPGLFVGCLVANMLSPYGVWDLVCGSLASLIAAYASYRLRDKPALVPLPPIIANGLIVGSMLKFVYGLPISVWGSIVWVAFGELIACYCIGYPLLLFLRKRKDIFRL